jgi:hypothetical protein
MSTLPPWKVDAWDLADDLLKIRQQWDPVRRILEDASLSDVIAPSVSAWSCGEQACHIVLAARAIAGAIERNLEEPNINMDGQWTRPTRSVLEGGIIPRGTARAPAVLDPVGHSREELLGHLPAAVAAWESLAGRAGDLPAISARAPHFALGYLNSVQWVRMCAVHTAHHLEIARDILGAAEPPMDLPFLREPG